MALTKSQIAAFYQQAEDAKKKFSGKGPDIKKVQEGDNRYRILPDWRSKSPLTFEAYRAYGEHWVKSLEKNDKGSNIVARVLCNRSTFNEKCPVCEAYFEHFQDETIPDDAKALIKEANAGTRFLVNALHVNGIEPDKPIVLELSYMVFTAIFGDPRKGSSGLVQSYIAMKEESLFDLNAGSDIIIKRSGKGFNTAYSVEMPKTPSNPVPESVLDQLTDLDEIINSKKHTAEDEAKVVAAIHKLASGGTPNAALNMAAFEPVKPSEPAAPVTPTEATPVSSQGSSEPLDMADADDILAELDLAI